MGFEKVPLVSQEEETRTEVEYKIKNNLMTNADFQALSVEDQATVKRILFEIYGEPVPQPAAMSSLEFTIFGLAKLFFMMNPPSSTPQYDAATQAFYDRFKQFIDQHELTTNPGDWYVPYAEANMLVAKQNRAEYMQQKQNIVGTF